MALSDVWTYFRSCDRSVYEVFACQGHEPREADVASFESEVGFRLEAEYREFVMSPLGGLYMAVREELWARPRVYEVGPYWSFLYGFFSPGLAGRCGLAAFGQQRVSGLATPKRHTMPDFLDVRKRVEQMRAEGLTGLVPCLKLEGEADVYCLNSDRRIVMWDHETGELVGVELTFSELLMREVRELEGRYARKRGLMDGTEAGG